MNRTRFLPLLWLLTSVLLLLNWLYVDSIFRKVVVSVFLIFVAVFSARPLQQELSAAKRGSHRSAEQNQAESVRHEHVNTQILREKYGSLSFLRTYWSLGFLGISTALSYLFPEHYGLDRLKWLALVVFFLDGLYLCAVIFFAKRNL